MGFHLVQLEAQQPTKLKTHYEWGSWIFYCLTVRGCGNACPQMEALGSNFGRHYLVRAQVRVTYHKNAIRDNCGKGFTLA